MRVLSYNIHRWGDDHAALARVFAACKPDVAMLQEAPTWFGTQRRRREMAASVGMRYAAGAARNIILVADGIEVSKSRGWRVWRPFVRRKLRLIATQLPGAAVGALIELDESAIALAVCHLGLHTRGRQHEIEQVLRGCESFGTPYLLVGDLNETPDGPVWKRLADAGLVDLGADAGPTFPASAPSRRIDGAHASAGLPARLLPLTGVSADDLAVASDHLPLLVEVSATSG